ncbi:sigma-70 family RNA polymerase sigma factor [Thalassomonas sp. M1454]|uniref:sigma-70 family RNA polymerase sigma factor n=1 Tax=Thalassomonas sp. M1454 TaxID=2594477 RepID=UPI0011813755|nr:sigma-70 family RNA polymerase sigma factor [Thalassomonas sp. M1454]TRX57967.1 sigma-70 family RNA polymerase sigma factor [Thalassomonas sp. M1454]
MDDLVQEATIHFMDAMQKYEHNHNDFYVGALFNYCMRNAIWRIQDLIKKELRNNKLVEIVDIENTAENNGYIPDMTSIFIHDECDQFIQSFPERNQRIWKQVMRNGVGVHELADEHGICSHHCRKIVKAINTEISSQYSA